MSNDGLPDSKSSPGKYVWETHLDIESAELDADYHDTGRPILVESFSEAPGFVLDIGCGAGANGALLKKRYPNAKVWGVEASRAAAAQASMCLDRVLVGQFEDFDLEQEGISKGSVDGVILADVLEHMYNPWSVMRALRPYLTDDAQVIVSVPNVRNLTLLNSLGQGYWEYESAFLLDITHIRFFTKTELHRFLFETGYRVDSLEYVLDGRLQEFYQKNSGANFSDVSVGRLKIEGVSKEELLELCTLQFVVRAKLGESESDLHGRYAKGAPVNAGSSMVGLAARSATSAVDAWMCSRVLSPVQSRLIEKRLRSVEYKNFVTVIVLDFGADDRDVLKTLGSFSLMGPLGVGGHVFVLSDRDGGYLEREAVSFIRTEKATIPRLVNSIAAQSGDEWVLMVSAGDEFTDNGLLVAALELRGNNDCPAFFCDELYAGLSEGRAAALRPAFNLDMLLSFPAALIRHWFYRREVLVCQGGFSETAEDAYEFDYILRLVEAGISQFGHVSEPLLCTLSPELVDDEGHKALIVRHLKRRGYLRASVQSSQSGRYRLIYNHDAEPLVSIVIPTKNQLALVQRCVESILEYTRYSSYEILIVDNNTDESDALEWLAAIESMQEEKVRVLRFPHEFNFSAINNHAVRSAKGEYLVLLNNDTAIIDAGWLDNLLNHAQRPEVGVVGAKLIFPDKRIQHAGIVLGLGGAPADHAFIGEALDAPGYMNRLQVDQNYSAVSAACLMIRKEVYEQVGGMDEVLFKVSYNDVDLCLKVREQGLLVVWTPFSKLLHEGSVSQTQVDTSSHLAKRKRFVGEQDAMYEKWLPLLARDPAYNPNFSLTQPGGFKLADTQISWRPLESWRPLPVILAHPADFSGCGNYRVMQPFKAQQDAGLIDGALSLGLMHVADLERYDPDVIVLQRQIGDERLEAMKRMHSFSRAFKVYELDDYLPNLPMKNAHREHMPKDVLKSLRRGLSFVDRFVVSTEPLAEAFAGLHSDIQVVKNRLPVSWWKYLPDLHGSQPRPKPRVGWGGGSSHTGDLEMIADVVRELAGEVDWVFFGMCPDSIRPYVKEYNPGVPIEKYSHALAALDLDLALAPVEDNLFNRCKSNLRLLEYGACGFPVVCSDIDCYRGDLPVTRVKNRFRDWVDAIRMHLADMDATRAAGVALRNAIHKDWLLEGESLEHWLQAWSGK